MNKVSKFKEWLKDHQSLIIGLLVLVLLLKGCTACQNERLYKYKQTQYEYVIDSMQSVINERSVDTADLCDTIHSLRRENTVLKSTINDLIEDRAYYRRQNRNLANVAENLSKQERNDTIK